MPNGMMTDAQVSVGDAEKFARPQGASVCKQTYDASCTDLATKLHHNDCRTELINIVWTLDLKSGVRCNDLYSRGLLHITQADVIFV